MERPRPYGHHSLSSGLPSRSWSRLDALAAPSGFLIRDRSALSGQRPHSMSSKRPHPDGGAVGSRTVLASPARRGGLVPGDGIGGGALRDPSRGGLSGARRNRASLCSRSQVSARSRGSASRGRPAAGPSGSSARATSRSGGSRPGTRGSRRSSDRARPSSSCSRTTGRSARSRSPISSGRSRETPSAGSRRWVSGA